MAPQGGSLKTPSAVLISDVHYSLSTLELADAAFRLAIDHAHRLRVPLIDCGDLTNDKASLRAEVVNRLIDACYYAIEREVPLTLLVGNHSLCNEKGKDHALEFLRPYATVIDTVRSHDGFNFIPYKSTKEEFLSALDRHDSPVIIHQGVSGANSGHYIQDHSAVSVQELGNRRTIGGHYHTRESLGNHSFVGNPYSLTFAETEQKGFQILYSDVSLEFVPTNLRKHLVIERDIGDLTPAPGYNPGDLVWVKLYGPRLQLERCNRKELAKKLSIGDSFKLDLIPDKDTKVGLIPDKTPKNSELMDALIDASEESESDRSALKGLYRKIM